jgi:prepilin-type N-terminal cleavage/methylation domain-containing protein
VRYAFTLIELLVVVTIIVVLLSLLTPAMDKAIYQTELTLCATRLKTIATGVAMYAVAFKRYYPHRPGVHDPAAGWVAIQLYNAASPVFSNGIPYDDRTTMSAAFDINALLTCPFSGKVDYVNSKPDSFINSNYSPWFGFGFPDNPGMFKLGDRLGWDNRKFSVVAGDWDHVLRGGPNYYGSHPDSSGRMTHSVLQDQGLPAGLKWTLSRWELNGDYRRLPVDLNYAFDNGAVQRYDSVLYDKDERMYPFPFLPSQTYDFRYENIPAN